MVVFNEVDVINVRCILVHHGKYGRQGGVIAKSLFYLRWLRVVTLPPLCGTRLYISNRHENLLEMMCFLKLANKDFTFLGFSLRMPKKQIVHPKCARSYENPSLSKYS